jgi:four helix bundle protein
LRKVSKNAAGFETAKQLIRAAGSVGANYRASVRAKSSADFTYKIEVVLEEADESLYWLEVVKDAKLQEGKELDSLINEANELTAIFAATDKTNKAKRNKKIAISIRHHTSEIRNCYNHTQQLWIKYF